MIMKPGEIITKKGEIDLNKASNITKLKVSNSGDRPVQVGSHYHFFETNEYLVFDRDLSYGKRLNIALELLFDLNQDNLKMLNL